jgi:hypothetical protein
MESQGKVETEPRLCGSAVWLPRFSAGDAEVNGPFAITVVGVVVVIAAIIINGASLPDGEPALPPDAGRSMGPALGVSGAPASKQNGDVKGDRDPAFDLVRLAPDGHAVMAGQAEPGSRVVVLDSQRPLGEVLADARGEWVFLPSAPLEPGEHVLELTAFVQDRAAVLSRNLIVVIVPEPGENIAGQVTRQRDQPLAMKAPRSGSGPATVLQAPGRLIPLSIDAVDQDPGEAPGLVEVRAGQNLWRIARNVYGAGQAYTIIHEANRSKIRDPELIYPGQIFLLPASGRLE